MAQEFIAGFLRRYHEGGHEDARNHWDGFICDPEQSASHSGTRVVVIIDECQDMKFYVHDVSEEKFKDMKDQGLLSPERGGIDLAATYDHQAQSRKAPMLVSGSAATLIFKTVMGGPSADGSDSNISTPLHS